MGMLVESRRLLRSPRRFPFKWWEFADPTKLPLVPATEAVRAAAQPPPITPVVEHGRRMYRIYGDQVALSGDMRYSANYPYLVIKADPRIIANHNAIYSEPFVEFLHKFFPVHIANKRLKGSGTQ